MKTKFEEVCDAYERVQSDFKKFESECHSFAVELVKNFINYFPVPPSQFSLYKMDENGEFILVRPAVINAITHAEDAYWHFGIGLTVSSNVENFPQDLILIHIFIRKNSGDAFYTRIALDPTEFFIEKNKPATFIPFFDFIQKAVVKSYEEGFQKFIGHDTVRKIGY